MAHHAQRLLACIDMGFGWQGGPSFLTGLVATRGGFESRNRYWQVARFKYEIGLVPRVVSEFAAIKSAFMVCGGRADTFLFRDSTDYEASTANGKLRGVLDDAYVSNSVGYGIPVYQITKAYTFASATYYRPIMVPASPIVYRNGSPVTLGTSAGNIAISGGEVTFVHDQSQGISSHTVGASHIFTLGSAFSPNLAIGGRIYVTGVTGTAADLLNDKSHAITNVSSAVITTSTNTTGLTATGGTAYYYPQPTESLTWAGTFDLKVRFDTDEIMPTVINRNGRDGELLIELPSVPLVEVRE